MQTLCGAVNKAANVILVDMSWGISSKKKKGCIIFMYSISKTLLLGTVTRLTLVLEARFCGRRLGRVGLDPSLNMLRGILICLGEGYVIYDESEQLYSAE